MQPCNRLLITGGAGFIGCNFILHQLKNYPTQQIINIDKLSYAANQQLLSHFNAFTNYRFIQADLCDTSVIRKLLVEVKIDAIIHFAAESHVDRSIKSPTPFIESNILGTYELLEAIRIVNPDIRLHHVSTDEVFGSLSPNQNKSKEDDAYAPNSPYSASKACSDHLVRAYHKTYGLRTSVSYCTNNYGPYQHLEKFIPTVIGACLQQKSIPIYGNGCNRRSWLYVADHVHALDLMLRTDCIGEYFNVGATTELSNLELAHMICHQFDILKPENPNHAQLIKHVSDRSGHDWRYALDDSKLRSQLGWQPRIDFKTGLAQTITHYMASAQQQHYDDVGSV